MKTSVTLLIFYILILLCNGCSPYKKLEKTDHLPTEYQGFFEDDYGISYQIDQEVFRLLPNDVYHIISWNPQQSYLLVQNDTSNTYAPGLFGKIDIMDFQGMEPYEWGFCLIAYEAKNLQAAIQASSDRNNPKVGCNGFPFTRMKRKE
ncbi:MAG: hypothetical protein AAFO07_28025 [Bacteroidota bacterium]